MEKMYCIQEMIIRRKIGKICRHLLELSWENKEIGLYFADDYDESGETQIVIDTGDHEITDEIILGMRNLGFVYQEEDECFVCYIDNIHDIGLIDQ